MARSQDPSSTPVISLVRTTPPTPKWFGDELSRVLVDVAARGDLAANMRHHRFGGMTIDIEVGAEWLAHRFQEPVDPSRILVTNGTQNALFITLMAAVGRGNLLLVEELSYYGMRKLAHFLGIEVQSIAMDVEGALPDAFEAACRTLQPKALFVLPTLHNPTTSVMSVERRLALAAIARRYGVALIEDDVYGLLPSNPPKPLAALAADITWHCVGLAKCISPGLRIGYLVAPSKAEVERAFAPVSTTSTWFVSPLSALITERLVRDGTGLKVLEAVRAEATARQQIAQDALKGIPFRSHPEALFLWLELPDSVPQQAIIDAAADRGIVIRNGNMFAVDQRKAPNALRFVVGSPEDRETLSFAAEVIAELIGQRMRAAA